MTNRAFHNDTSLAVTVRTQVADHTVADEIIQGKYWEKGKGCFIGCIAHGSDPSIVEQLTGFPLMLTKLAEGIFESLPNEVAKGFPQRIIEAPRIGADLSLVSWKFLHWLIDDVLTEHADDKTRAACSPALEIVAAKSRGEEVSSDAAARAADAADAAAYAAAYAADAAARAARAARAAARAADAAARAADAADAAARIRQADKLVELLGAA